MAGGAVQQNGIFSNPHHHNQQPHMESDPPDSRKRPLETPTEASSTKRTNTGGKSSGGDAGSWSGLGECCFLETGRENGEQVDLIPDTHGGMAEPRIAYISASVTQWYEFRTRYFVSAV